MNIKQIIHTIKALEEINDQSITFTLHGDGSGSFQDFWEGDCAQVEAYEDQDELNHIINKYKNIEPTP